MFIDPIYIKLIIAGLGGGFLAGFLGIGGGIIYILILPLALAQVGTPPSEIAQYTIANSIFGTAAAALFGSISLIRNKDFYWKEVGIVSLSAVAASFLLLFTFVNTPLYSQQFFAAVVIVFLGIILAISVLRSFSNIMFQTSVKNKSLWYVFTGAVAGAMSALTGLGGGTITVPLLAAGLHMDIKRAKSISLGVIFVASTCITVYNMIDQPEIPFDYFHVGYIAFPVSIALSIGVLFGSPFGVWVANKISSRIISYIFILFIILVIIRKVIILLQH